MRCCNALIELLVRSLVLKVHLLNATVAQALIGRDITDCKHVLNWLFGLTICWPIHAMCWLLLSVFNCELAFHARCGRLVSGWWTVFNCGGVGTTKLVMAAF